LKTPSQEKVIDISKTTEKTPLTIGASNKPLEVEDVDIISVFPTSEFVLRVKEIHPLIIFYSPKHKVVFKRKRKKRRIDHTQALVPRNTTFEVLWKSSQTIPVEELVRLTQFTGDYAPATMDKATDIQQLLKEEDDMIMQLEQGVSMRRKLFLSNGKDNL